MSDYTQGLEGRVALVTGGSRRIGAAIVRVLHGAGMHVALHYRRSRGAAEALAFGERAGLDMAKVLDAVTKGAANSWYLENRGPTMLTDQFAFGFAVDWMKKDLGLCLAEAAGIGADVPLTALVDGARLDLSAR